MSIRSLRVLFALAGIALGAVLAGLTDTGDDMHFTKVGR
jgi:hypothetical protein